mmetsp:Transcript_24912/g.28803  ORF Transcript_24912/g.28803 Transcript_24912/m.28803 type:complete len:167 (+) Transcript_24912:132-632(+)
MTTRNKPLIVIVAFTMLVIAKADLSTTDIIKIFNSYDVKNNKELDCQSEYTDSFLCPKDKDLPCRSVGEIENHCISLIGEDVAKEMKGVGTGEKKNAITGCKKYVGYHLDLDQIGCCESEHCEEWLEHQFVNYDDDDEPLEDDDDYLDDDDEEDEYREYYGDEDEL